MTGKGLIQVYPSLLVKHTEMVPISLGARGVSTSISTAGLNPCCKPGLYSPSSYPGGPGDGSLGKGQKLCMVTPLGKGMSGALMLQDIFQESRSAQGPANCNQHLGY